MIEWLVAFGQIMLINIILSVDNALVIALASRRLPPKEKKLAMRWGVFGAVALRILLALIVSYLLLIPWLMSVGSILLLWIAVKLIVQQDGHHNIRESSNLGKAVWTIIIADFVMSLDNVLAIVGAAGGDMILISIGLLFSIPLVIWGSNIVSNLIARFPILVYIGSGVLGYVAGEMFIKDKQVEQVLIAPADPIHQWLPWAAAIGVVVIGWIWNKLTNPVLSQS